MRLDHLLSRESLENRLTRLSASGCEGSARAAPAHLDTCIARDMKVTDMINTNNINSLKQFKVFDGCSHHGQDDSSRSRTYVIRRKLILIDIQLDETGPGASRDGRPR